MTPVCVQVLEHLGKRPLPPGLAAHLRGCPACAGLAETFGALQPPAAPPPEPRAVEAARARALRELARAPRPSPWWREAVELLLSGLLMVAVGLVALTVRGLRNEASPLALAGVGTLLMGILAGGAFAAVAPARRRLRWAVVAVAAGTAALVVLTGSGVAPPASFLGAGLPCFFTELLTSAAPLAVALWLLTRSAYQPERALAAGLATGAVGMFILHLHCANGLAAHLACFHVLPWLLLAGLAVLLRAALPSRSFAP